MSNSPFVSIIVNCFNGEEFLKQALDSIYSQTYNNWEIIFFDNCSKDSSSVIANGYDNRLKYFYSDVNLTLGEARRQAVELASGDWVAFLDVDDIWFNNKLEDQVDFISKNEDANLIYASVIEFFSDGREIPVSKKKSRKVDFTYLLENFDINMVTPLIDKKFLLKNDLNFDGDIEASEEYNLFMRVSAIGNVYFQNRVLGKYRLSESSLTNQKIDKWYKERIKTLEQCISDSPGLLASNASGFLSAIGKGLYYQARHDYKVGNLISARKKIRHLAFSNIKYIFLYFLSLSSLLWNLSHGRWVKGKLTSIFKFFLFSKN